MARRTRRIKLVRVVFVWWYYSWKINAYRLSLSLNEASRKCNKQNAYIGTQITEKTYSKSSHAVIARQLHSLN